MAPIPEPDRILLQGNSEAYEAADALGTAAWHARGWDGAGVKVAVFDVQWELADAPPHALELGDVETHDCWVHPSCGPPMDNLRPRFSYERGGHGIACAEVIRDLAPGVELHLVRVNALTTFENALSWAARNDIDIISMSLSFFNESMYDGSGAVNDAMDRLAGVDTLLVTSAGNYAQEHWREDFRDTDGDGWHEFDGGDEHLEVTYRGGSGRATLLWNDFGDCGDTDLDIYAVDGEGRVLGRAGNRQDADDEDCSPSERLSINVPADRPVFLRVH
ncbi:MAG: S8 family serine peptidase, partial [Myxococcota bacterium]|nr:S8 family serine peptidase [Myxococcota bacterium]